MQYWLVAFNQHFIKNYMKKIEKNERRIFQKMPEYRFLDIFTEIIAYLDQMTWLQINLLSLLLYYLFAIGAQIQSLKFRLELSKRDDCLPVKLMINY